MVQGQGKYQQEKRLKTESKIVAFLNLQPFGFNELQLISGIRRNSLRSTLDSLVIRNIAIVKKEDHDPGRKCDKDHSPKFGTKVRRGTYYSLNPNNKESKRLLDAYYNDKESKPPITKELKKELLASIDKFHRKIENENDTVLEQITIFRKDIEPFIDKADGTMKLWLDCLALFRRDRQLVTRTLKIFAVKLRLRLS
jgi:hypothetical protein